MFRSDDPYLDSDAVFGVRPSLIADRKQQPDGTCLVGIRYSERVGRGPPDNASPH